MDIDGSCNITDNLTVSNDCSFSGYCNISRGLVVACQVLTGTITLTLPLCHTYFLNCANTCTITLPTPLVNGTCVNIRNFYNCTGSCTISHASGFCYNSGNNRNKIYSYYKHNDSEGSYIQCSQLVFYAPYWYNMHSN